MRPGTWNPITAASRSIALLAAMAMASVAPARRASLAEVDFNFQVRPILSDKCFKCHGPDTANRKAGLRLDTRTAPSASRNRAPGPIVPRDLAESELYRRITPTTRPSGCRRSRWAGRSPPQRSTSSKRWIEQGAEWQPHWSFRPPVAPPGARR